MNIYVKFFGHFWPQNGPNSYISPYEAPATPTGFTIEFWVRGPGLGSGVFGGLVSKVRVGGSRVRAGRLEVGALDF